jgi:glucuronate isomerase
MFLLKTFITKDFLLESETAKTLYHSFAEGLPIADYHCHINPREIAENRSFSDISEVWLGGDHYKWRFMRAMGVSEEYITGNKSPKEKFNKWAEVLPYAVGNPLYHWSHLELLRYFDIDDCLSPETADVIWQETKSKLTSGKMNVRDIIRKSNVKVICTTDDPADDLLWHKKIAAEGECDFKVYPAFRPDKALNIEKNDFAGYIKKLGETAGAEIVNLQALLDVLTKRLDFFAENGSRVSDHAFDYVMYRETEFSEIAEIFTKVLSGAKPTNIETEKYKTFIMLYLAKEYKNRGFIMQLHYGCRRDNNPGMFEKLGPDTGFDCIASYAPTSELAAFLGAAEAADSLPKTIIYSLNPTDNAAIDTIIGCFSGGRGKIQHGSAWWFNDHIDGMKAQMTSLANIGSLAAFVGMLTDSRSFLSYPRHEYFRRILCNLLGEYVEKGTYPPDMDTLGKIVTDISFNNTMRYFGFADGS